ncbi:MAG: PEP-CTERM sorting domain-containing protein, partial [Planctomycetota bacterium]|nr:PEP-CTERM sorting domain-containing protein [Planctomycetota bacterium]
VQILNANAVQQSDGSTTVAETVVTPAPLHTEVGAYNATLLKLTDTNPDNLDDSTGPVGPADATWAFQWDVTVAPNSTVQISKDKNIVPEPATVGLMGMGLAVAVVARVKKSRRQAA